MAHARTGIDGRGLVGLPHPPNAVIIIMSLKLGYMFMLIFCLLTLRLGGGVPSTHDKGEQLSRAYASPLNVDPKLDCALKELAWGYAKKLLPRVRKIMHSYNWIICCIYKSLPIIVEVCIHHMAIIL